MNLIETLEREAIDALTEMRPIPEFRPGDTLRVGVKVVEGDRSRVQNFEGVCIARSNKGVGSSFTVRKISFGEGVERVFPLYSPAIDSIEVVRRGAVRRAKLYYLRGRTGKSARIAERRDARPPKRQRTLQGRRQGLEGQEVGEGRRLMASGYRVAVVGATGNVGREILNILAERQFPLAEVAAVASARSTGDEIDFGELGETLKVKNLDHFDFRRLGHGPVRRRLGDQQAARPAGRRRRLHGDRQFARCTGWTRTCR